MKIIFVADDLIAAGWDLQPHADHVEAARVYRPPGTDLRPFKVKMKLQRVANTLQLEVAEDDWYKSYNASCTRSIMLTTKTRYLIVG